MSCGALTIVYTELVCDCKRFYSTILPRLGQYVVRPWLHSLGLEEKTGEELTAEMDEWGSKKLQEALLSLGGFYVKTGQVLSTRVDLFSKPYTERLRILQDSLPPVDAAEIRDIVSKELCGGGSLSELLKDFEDEPLGTASIAQVHRAVLNDGREVAIKVLRPNMEPVLRGDIANLKVFALAARGRLPVDYYPVFCELERALDGELDFLNEAQSAAKAKGREPGSQATDESASYVSANFHTRKPRNPCRLSTVHSNLLTDQFSTTNPVA
ncbi:ubiB [Symbiodinium pilosum]|uniref:UbiB protein n=1 Tax=Symbiodinium pilosum TaxID=2952 RepID=A0A812YJ35_SYMPI|nr:ubiB [Symbiodinium pilosum]